METEKEKLECPNCGERTVEKPERSYSVFEERRHPDGVCENCGAFYWKRPDMNIPFPVLKPAERKEEQKPTFKKLSDEEEKRRERKKKKKKRWLRNRNLRRAMEAGKSRI